VKIYRYIESQELVEDHDSNYSERWHAIIEERAIGNPYPFSDWFNGANNSNNANRVYIPFDASKSSENSESNELEVDTDVENALKDHGYKIIDYRGGYCEDGYGRKMRIGKVLPRLLSEDLRELELRYERGEIYNLEREQESVRNYYQGVMDVFQNSSLRRSKGEIQYYVVISQDVHDVAKMSTGRDWTSCMELGEGSNYSNVFCDVAEGTLIAYLIYANDLEIRNPLARLLIRRFVNTEGASIAIPEETVYGNDLAGFSEVVNQWINERQQISLGLYRRKGGEYSDSLGDEKYVMPSDPEGVLSVFNLESVSPIVEYVVTDHIKEMYLKLHGDFGYREDREERGELEEGRYEFHFNTRKEAEEYISNETGGYDYEEMIEGIVFYRIGDDDDFEDSEGRDEEREKIEDELRKMERFGIREVILKNEYDIRKLAIEKMLDFASGTYSPEVMNQVKAIVFVGKQSIYHNMALKRKLVEKYPEIISEEDFNNMDDVSVAEYIVNLPWGPDKERQRESMLGGIHDHLVYFLQDAERFAGDGIFEPSGYTNFKSWVLDPLEKLGGQLKEETIQKLLSFVDVVSKAVSDLQSQEVPNDLKRHGLDYESWLLRDVAHLFSMFSKLGADTPRVQQFYQNQLSSWDLENDVDRFGWSIARLGENGRQFISFMKQQVVACDYFISQVEGNSYSQKRGERLKEKYLYIIDALENGTGFSQKYRWARKYQNWYRMAELA